MDPTPADADGPAPASVPAEAAPPSPERERDAADRLSRIHGAGELQAVLLALLMAAASIRNAANMVDFPALFGPMRILKWRICIVHFSKALKRWMSRLESRG